MKRVKEIEMDCTTKMQRGRRLAQLKLEPTLSLQRTEPSVNAQAVTGLGGHSVQAGDDYVSQFRSGLLNC